MVRTETANDNTVQTEGSNITRDPSIWDVDKSELGSGRVG